MTTAPCAIEHDKPPGADGPRRATLRVTGLAGLLFAVVVAACTSGVPSGSVGRADGSPPPDATISPPMPSAAAPVGSPMPGASAAPESNVATDPVADATPGYVDIVRIQGEGRGGVLTLTMSLAADVPTGSPAVGQLAYRFAIDANGDGTWDHMAALELAAGGGFVPVFLDRASGVRSAGPGSYPGTAYIAGRVITLTVPLAALSCPPVVGIQGAAEQVKGGLTVRDQVPDDITAWVRIQTGCEGPSGAS
jgi:hypothetical protein